MAIADHIRTQRADDKAIVVARPVNDISQARAAWPAQLAPERRAYPRIRVSAYPRIRAARSARPRRRSPPGSSPARASRQGHRLHRLSAHRPRSWRRPRRSSPALHRERRPNMVRPDRATRAARRSRRARLDVCATRGRATSRGQGATAALRKVQDHARILVALASLCTLLACDPIGPPALDRAKIFRQRAPLDGHPFVPSVNRTRPDMDRARLHRRLQRDRRLQPLRLRGGALPVVPAGRRVPGNLV